ncbi:MAG TPA: glycosyltransferase family 4 protein [Burkholderiales bacterium]|nr:glycosyltransferase family 4 protein [Burkholderiales bacterium]
MKKSRILLVVRYPVGGIRTFFRYVYTKFDPDKYSFTLIAPEMTEARVLLDDLKGLELTPVFVTKNVTSSQLFREVLRVARENKFDLIHSHGFTSGICSIPAAKLTRTPHIMTAHDVFTSRQFQGIRGIFKKTILAALMMTIDCIHCVSDDARENLLSYLWMLRFSKSRVIVIKNGIDTRQFQRQGARDFRRELGLPADALLIGFLGRFMSQKGFKYLVEALVLLERQNLPRRILVLSFGADGYIREEREAVRKKGLADSILFLPFVADPTATLKGLDVVAMPSLWEACGLLAMETMVAGVPLVGTSCVGLREVLRDTPAKMVPPEDGNALYEALLDELQQPTKGIAQEFAAEAAARFDVIARAAEIEAMTQKYART